MTETRKVRMLTWPPPYPGLCIELNFEDYIIESIEGDPDAVVKADDIGRRVAWDLDRDTYEPMPLTANPQTLIANVRPATADEVKAWADNEASTFEDARRLQRGRSIWKRLVA